MNEPTRPRRVWRSIGAVLAGIAVGVALCLGTDGVMHATGVFPQLGQSMTDALFLLATAYRTVYGILAGYVTARLAPTRPVLHALAGGLVAVIASAAGAAATWDKSEFGPHWYPLALIALALPSAWAGGHLYKMSAGRDDSST